MQTLGIDTDRPVRPRVAGRFEKYLRQTGAHHPPVNREGSSDQTASALRSKCPPITGGHQ